MHRIHFDCVEAAVGYAKQHGGWIFVPEEGGDVQWFDAAVWTQTPIIKAVRGSGTLGTWPMFDPVNQRELEVAKQEFEREMSALLGA